MSYRITNPDAYSKIHQSSSFQDTVVGQFSTISEVFGTPENLARARNVADHTELGDEEANATLDGQLLSSLVGVVSEIYLNEAMLGSLYKFPMKIKEISKQENLQKG
jgi:hypothetical protein